MSEHMNDYNIDDILAEFADYSESITSFEPSKPRTESAKPQSPRLRSEPRPAAEAARPREKAPVPPKAEPRREREKSEERERNAPPRKKAEKPAVSRRVREVKAPREYIDEYLEKKKERRRTASGPVRTIVSLICVPVVLAVLLWITVNVHPDAGAVTASSVRKTANLVKTMDVFLNNVKSEALGELTYIRKLYTIPEEAVSAPRPNEAAFGVTTNMAEVQAVIDDAADLLKGQTMVWNPNLDFYPDNNVYYYRDATILAIVWREKINNRSATVAEIKVADGSQLRRKLSEDAYGSSVQNYASALADSANAVVAMNADFYGFRQIGVTVYNRQLFRFSPDKLDNCFINSAGDMLFMKAGSIADEYQMQQYIADNDILFSLSFGPILVDNGVLQHCDSYPIGEMNLEYSRAGLGMVDDLHYLYMTVNHCNGQNPRCNVNEFGELMYSKGCVKAYNLDGGQTSEIVFNGRPINYIDFNAERTVTDIIYFATALPESEVSR
ncbi:MAG: phosphodiester glycosidase family protein [Eubacteriales bacterium]|nr:phosphodiester glycosidase family protein [Eubacteriales bacterium]